MSISIRIELLATISTAWVLWHKWIVYQWAAGGHCQLPEQLTFPYGPLLLIAVSLKGITHAGKEIECTYLMRY